MSKMKREFKVPENYREILSLLDKLERFKRDKVHQRSINVSNFGKQSIFTDNFQLNVGSKLRFSMGMGNENQLLDISLNSSIRKVNRALDQVYAAFVAATGCPSIKTYKAFLDSKGLPYDK